MFEKVVQVGLFFDFYGKLLSIRQYESIELYYIHDLTLSEIGEQLDISRQGVYDLIKRAEASLYKYEKTLGLVEKFEDNRIKTKELKRLLEKLKDLVDINKDNKAIFENINIIMEQLLENNQEVR